MQLLMSLYTYFRISKPSASKVAENEVDKVYKRLRARTFWGATAAYSLYYVCRMTLSVVKQPLIDSGLLTAGELGLVGSALLFIYAHLRLAVAHIAAEEAVAISAVSWLWDFSFPLS